MAKRKATGTFSVSGPGYDTLAASRGEAFSYAQTIACRLREPIKLYIRDLFGMGLGYVERLDDGLVVTYSHEKKMNACQP